MNDAARDTGGGATELTAASSDLSTQAETMRAQVEAFIASIKAA